MTELLKTAPELSTKETTEKDPVLVEYPKLGKEFRALIKKWDTLSYPYMIKSINFKWQYLSSHEIKYLNDCKNIEELRLDGLKTIDQIDFRNLKKISCISVKSIDKAEFNYLKDTIELTNKLLILNKKELKQVKEYGNQLLIIVDGSYGLEAHSKTNDVPRWKSSDSRNLVNGIVDLELYEKNKKNDEYIKNENRKEIEKYMEKWNAKYDSKDYLWAIIDYTKVIELDPNDFSAYYERAMCKKQIGDNESAKKDFDKSRENRHNRFESKKIQISDNGWLQ